MRTQTTLVRFLILTGTLTAVTAPAVAQGEQRFRIAVETSVTTISGHDLIPAGVEVIRAGAIAGTGVARAIRSSEISYIVVWRTEPKRLRPGDLVRYKGVQPALETSVPDIRVDVDETTGRIVGVGPSGVDVHLRVGYHTTSGTVRSFDEVARCGADGRFAVDLPDAALAPGDHGTATWSDPSGHEFSAPFSVFQGTVMLDTPKVSVASALGEPGHLEHRAVGATAAVSHSLVTRGAADEARLDVTDVILTTPVEAGTSITVTRERPLVGRTSVSSLLVPELTVDVVPATDQVVGSAPPSTPVRVTLRAPDGTLHSREVTSSSGGRVAVDFAGAVDIDRGAAANTSAAPVDGVVV